MRCWLRVILLLKPFILIFISTGLEPPAQTPHSPPHQPLSCAALYAPKMSHPTCLCRTSRSTCNILVKPFWRLHQQPFERTCDEISDMDSHLVYAIMDFDISMISPTHRDTRRMSASQFPVLDWRTT
ncbi:hypothetical protein JB92DRAFT_359484 [Gautieria morchelliformis]|nr:hypothetical protein JB92DRAFT_2288515 [Gautieria morchelliformis]KAF8511719.1 hypothetical protein JB92DRAFT_359484 [Gautieria morchelliformis]